MIHVHGYLGELSPATRELAKTATLVVGVAVISPTSASKKNVSGARRLDARAERGSPKPAPTPTCWWSPAVIPASTASQAASARLTTA
ncbi:MAG: hypothetical protein R2722_01290 [Tessaracoccus sp.]